MGVWKDRKGPQSNPPVLGAGHLIPGICGRLHSWVSFFLKGATCERIFDKSFTFSARNTLSAELCYHTPYPAHKPYFVCPWGSGRSSIHLFDHQYRHGLSVSRRIADETAWPSFRYMTLWTSWSPFALNINLICIGPWRLVEPKPQSISFLIWLLSIKTLRHYLHSTVYIYYPHVYLHYPLPHYINVTLNRVFPSISY